MQLIPIGKHIGCSIEICYSFVSQLEDISKGQSFAVYCYQIQSADDHVH